MASAGNWSFISSILSGFIIYIADLGGKEKGNGVKEKKEFFHFGSTVIKVELADIAFAIDSMLAAVALGCNAAANWLDVTIGGIDGGQFTVMLLGGIIGLVIMRFAANGFVKLLQTRPSLEIAAFLIVGWVGVKLAVFTLAHPQVGILDPHFPESTPWKLVFWIVLIAIAIWWLCLSQEKKGNKGNTKVVTGN